MMILEAWLGFLIFCLAAIAASAYGRRAFDRVEAEAARQSFAGLGDSLMRLHHERKRAELHAHDGPQGIKGAGDAPRQQPAGGPWADVQRAGVSALEGGDAAQAKSPIVSIVVLHADGRVVRFTQVTQAVQSPPRDPLHDAPSS